LTPPKDKKAPEVLSDTGRAQVKERESTRILAKIGQDTHVMAFAINRKMKSSQQIAVDLDKFGTYGKSQMAFSIGGSLGLSDADFGVRMKGFFQI
jgi:23S rRNA (pseudouridine1915-N3)-methyltransferase